MPPLKTIGLGLFGAILAAAWIGLQTARFEIVSRPRAAEMPSDAEFGRRVRDYLLKNPEVLIESLQRFQDRQQKADTNEIAKIIAARSDDILQDPATPVGGNPQGDANLVEFFDYNCPYCRRVAPILNDIEKSDPNLRIVYKEWPILGPKSEFAARAALASRSQGKYVEFHKAMMLSGGLMNDSKVIEVAPTVGLDVERLKRDMEAPEIREAIERNRELARALRITGTPSFVIGNNMLRGAADAEVIRGLIRQAREK